MNKYLNDPDIVDYMNQNGMKKFEFIHYTKGRSELGSLVESMVKITKRLTFSSIRNTVISYKDFVFLINYVGHMANRRPIAFKDALRDSNITVPTPITPEMLLHGRELVSVNIIPELNNQDDNDPEWMMNNSKTIINCNYCIRNYLELYPN